MSQPESRIIWSSKIKLCSINAGQDDKYAAEFQAVAEPVTLSGNPIPHEPNSLDNMNSLTEQTEKLESVLIQSREVPPKAETHNSLYDGSIGIINAKSSQKNVACMADIEQDTDSEMEINEFLDNDEEITIPKFNATYSLEPEPGSSVLSKKATAIMMSENRKDETKLQQNGKSKDASYSELDDDDEAYSDNMQETDDEIGEFKKFIKYICPQCGKTCLDLWKWKQHINLKHKLHTIEALNMEISTDKNGKWIHTCRECNAELKNPIYSRSFIHRMTHLPFGKHCICRICSTGCYSRYMLVRHIKRTHASLLKNVEAVTSNIEESKYLKHIRLRCPLCFEDQFDLRQNRLHLEQQHDYFNHVKSQLTFKKDSVTCNVCNHIIRQKEKSFIINHMLLHETHKSFTCELCNNFEHARKQKIVDHVKEEHFQQQSMRFKCNYCNLAFSKRPQRRKHYQREHHVKEDECKICHKYFSNASLLLMHMNAANHH